MHTTLSTKTSLIMTLPTPCTYTATRRFTTTNIRLLTTLNYSALTFNTRAPSTTTLLSATHLLSKRRLGTHVHRGLTANVACTTTQTTTTSTLRPNANNLLHAPGGVLNVRCYGTVLRQRTTLAPLTLPQLNTTRNNKTKTRTNAPVTDTDFLHNLPRPS